MHVILVHISLAVSLQLVKGVPAPPQSGCHRLDPSAGAAAQDPRCKVARVHILQSLPSFLCHSGSPSFLCHSVLPQDRHAGRSPCARDVAEFYVDMSEYGSDESSDSDAYPTPWPSHVVPAALFVEPDEVPVVPRVPAVERWLPDLVVEAPYRVAIHFAGPDAPADMEPRFVWIDGSVDHSIPFVPLQRPALGNISFGVVHRDGWLASQFVPAVYLPGSAPAELAALAAALVLAAPTNTYLGPGPRPASCVIVFVTDSEVVRRYCTEGLTISNDNAHLLPLWLLLRNSARFLHHRGASFGIVWRPRIQNAVADRAASFARDVRRRLAGRALPLEGDPYCLPGGHLRYALQTSHRFYHGRIAGLLPMGMVLPPIFNLGRHPTDEWCEAILRQWGPTFPELPVEPLLARPGDLHAEMDIYV